MPEKNLWAAEPEAAAPAPDPANSPTSSPASKTPNSTSGEKQHPPRNDKTSPMILTHYTDRRNLDAIRESRVLKCALSLMTPGERLELAKKKRRKCEPLACGAILRDQKVLKKGRVKAWTMEFDEFVEYLNGHVFFWANTVNGEKARRGFRRKYSPPANVGLRCRLDDLCAANPEANILCAPHNSAWEGMWIPFCPLEAHNEEWAVEVVVPGKVRLPDNTKWEREEGKWENFFPAGN